MRPYFLGKIVYFFGFPLFRILIRNTIRAYVIILVDNEVLVTKNWLGFQKKWRLPGGGVQKGERHIVAAQRELKEEVGIATHEQNLEPVGTKPFRSSFNYDYYLYVLRLPEKPELAIDKREIVSAEFMLVEKLSALSISEEVQNFLRLAK
jgi:8-oxo-dGTP diphosphatase